MGCRKLFVLLLVAAVAPMAEGHDMGGTPKLYCEWEAGDWNVHDFGSGDGFSLSAATSGHEDDCIGASLGDATHYEYADGGAYLVSGSDAAQANACGWETPDHPSFPVVFAHDLMLPEPVKFWVYADSMNNLPPVDPSEPNCGDLEADVGVECLDVCAVAFPPGLDSTYLVFVEAGRTGHVWTGTYVDGSEDMSLEDSVPHVRPGAHYRSPTPYIPCIYGCA